MARELLTLGEAAAALGVRDWQLRRAFERGLLQEPTRVGINRVVRRTDLSRIAIVLRQAGYLDRPDGAGKFIAASRAGTAAR